MRPRHRLHAAAATALVGAAALSGCASVVDGHGAAQGSASSSPTSSSAPTSPSATFPSTSGPGSTTPAASLAGLLAPAPSGSRPWGTAWSDNASPTVVQFAQHVYPASAAAAATAQLVAQGLDQVVHVTWIASNSDQTDEILLHFDTVAGARSRYLSATAAKAEESAQVAVPIAGSTQAIGYYSPTLDDLGNVRAIIYGQVANIVMELFFYSPATFDKPTATASALAQLSRLPS